MEIVAAAFAHACDQPDSPVKLGSEKGQIAAARRDREVEAGEAVVTQVVRNAELIYVDSRVNRRGLSSVQTGIHSKSTGWGRNQIRTDH